MQEPANMLCPVLLVLMSTTAICDEKDKTAETKQPTPAQLTFVRSKVLPLLEARCFECHRDGKKLQGGLLLGSRAAMLKGGDSGPALVPGKPNESLLVEAIRYESFEMPPRSRMPQQEVDILVRWVEEGAHWPADLEPTETTEAAGEFPLQERRKSHWAWQPVGTPAIPVINGPEWIREPLDAFIARRLQARNMKPAGDADRYTLIRRLYFDLIGLPPSVEQVTAFVNDESGDDAAIRKVVDELLTSPHFGERWGRHWLDLVRYAETLGHEFDYPLHNAWRYRDYVIRAFNEDVPYDQFVREHVAGDLLQNPRRHPTEQYNESVIGTGFWFLCEDKHSPVDVKGEEAAKVDNQLDVFSKTFLGMTVACARCHDHKFDAISTVDYYALSGFLQSSRRQTAWLDPGRRIEDRIRKIQAVRENVTTEINRRSDDEEFQQQLVRYITAALEVTHGAPAAGEKPEEGLKRDPAVVAQESKTNVDVLRKLVRQLRNKESSKGNHFLSLPATLAQSAKPDAERTKQWQAATLRPPGPSETTGFSVLRDGLPGDWFATGHAFEGMKPGAIPGLEWRNDGLQYSVGVGVSSATLSKELRGTLMSPTFELNHPEILVRVAGQGTRMRLIIDGYQMFEFNGLLFNGAKQAIDTDGQFRWLRFGGDVHRYQGHRMHIEFLDEGNGWFNVAEIRFANRPGAAPPSVEQTIPLNLKVAEVLKADGLDAESAIAQWAEEVVSNRPLKLAAAFDLSLVSADSVNEWTTLATGIPAPVPVLAITEGTEENEHVFIRGSHRNMGPAAPRQILTALRTGAEQPIRKGSGRLELADKLVTDDNPLVARVAVNRIWHHLFGRGIVESTDNFGVLGQPPTHPELLDYLATRFRKNGWSVKSLIRDLVLSRTYRMSSERHDESDRKDPTNELFHRANIRRLQGEAVRDGILAVSGRLDRTQFGPPVPVHLTAFMQGRGRPGSNGPLDGNGRRSIYVSVNRNFLSPFMQAFDVPAPVTTTGQRTVSNVPAQALIMLNNDFVNQQAKVWAEKLLATKPATTQVLLSDAWQQLFSHPPTPEELQPLLSFAGISTTASLPSLQTLTEICHVLLNSKEFLFLN